MEVSFTGSWFLMYSSWVIFYANFRKDKNSESDESFQLKINADLDAKTDGGTDGGTDGDIDIDIDADIDADNWQLFPKLSTGRFQLKAKLHDKLVYVYVSVCVSVQKKKLAGNLNTTF